VTTRAGLTRRGTRLRAGSRDEAAALEDEPAAPDRLSRLAPTIVVIVLLVATAAAFAVAQRRKLDDIPLTGPRLDRAFSPGCRCPRPTAELSFRLTRRETIDVTVLDDAGDQVRTLASGLPRRRGNVSLRWDGRDDAGAIVPEGEYRVRVHLRGADRTIDVHHEVVVDVTPPRARIVSARPRRLRFGRGRVLVQYGLSERARPVLLLDGRRVARGRRSERGWLEWWGGIDGRDVPRGTYRLTLVGRDDAGNVSRPSPPVTITVR
jgi:hypothetical protein